MSFLRLKNTVQEGDLVVLWGGRDFSQFCIIKANSATHNNRGMFSHDKIIGVPYGNKVGIFMNELKKGTFKHWAVVVRFISYTRIVD